MPGARGEGVIYAGDREVRILLTNRALADAERATGKSIIALAQNFAAGETGVNDVAHLLRAGMDAARRDARAGGRTVTIRDAYDVMDEAGFSPIAALVMECVSNVLSYDGSEGEEDAPNL